MEAVVRAFHWLKSNNPLYQQFLAQLKTLYSYFPTTTVSGVGNPLPMKTSDVEIQSGMQVTAEELRVNEGYGMIIEADPFTGLCCTRIKGNDDLVLLDSAGVQRFIITSDDDLNRLIQTELKGSQDRRKIVSTSISIW